MTQKNKKGLLWLFCIVFSVIFDQITKFLAVEYLKPIDTFPIIKDALHLTYVTNYGAAFGILAGQRWVFLIISSIAIVAVGIYLYNKRDEHPIFCLALSLIIGGGIGNMIDRTLIGYVVDFIDFRLINFAVFNVADICVCVGCGFMFLWILRFAEFEDTKPKITENEESDDDSDR